MTIPKALNIQKKGKRIPPIILGSKNIKSISSKGALGIKEMMIVFLKRFYSELYRYVCLEVWAEDTQTLTK